jgi:hypothetical protein
MNDRMTELYAAACLYAREKQLDRKSEDKDVGEFVKCMSEKFAELIVRECCRVLEIEGAETGQEPYYYGASLIEEHFGVEEK